MRVCFISGEYPPMEGGIADQLVRLRHALEGQGVESVVITSRLAGSVDDSVYAAISKWGFASWPAIAAFLRKTRADIAHIQYQTAAFGMSPAINLLPMWLRRTVPDCAVVTTFHDLRFPYLFPKAGRLRPMAVRTLLRTSHAAILTNEEDFAGAQRDAQPTQRLRLIPLGNALPPELPPDYDPNRWRQTHGVAADELLLCYFGLLNSSKGVEHILEALALLRGEGHRCRLLIIGGGVGGADPTNRTYRERLLGLTNELDLARSIVWTGRLSPEEVSKDFAAADMCLLPFLDGASFRRSSLIAAFAHGIPVITTTPAVAPPGSSLPALASGQNCLLVPAGDADALAEAALRLASSPELWRTLSLGAKATACAFSWPEIARQTAALYGEVARQGA